MATQLLVSPSSVDVGLPQSPLHKSNDPKQPVQPQLFPSKYLQQYSSLAANTLSTPSTQLDLGYSSSTSSLLMYMFAAVQVSFDHSNLDSGHEHSHLHLQAPVRPPHQETIASPKSNTTNSVNTATLRTKTSQPQYEYIIMPRKTKINIPAMPRVTRASARHRPLSTSAASADSSQSNRSATESVGSTMMVSIEPDHVQNSCTGNTSSQDTDVQPRTSPAAVGEQDSQQEARSEEQRGKTLAEVKLGQAAGIVSTDLPESEHVAVHPSLPSTRSATKRKYSGHDEPLNIDQGSRKKSKPTLPVKQTKSNVQSLKKAISSTIEKPSIELSAESSSLNTATVTPTAVKLAENSTTQSCASSDLSDPPSSIGSTPPGFVSPDEHFAQLRVSKNEDTGALLRRSGRNRKATARAVEFGHSRGTNVEQPRRHSEPLVKRVTFVTPPRTSRGVSLDLHTSSRGTKRKAPAYVGLAPPEDSILKKRKTAGVATLVDSVDASPQQPVTDTYNSDQATRKAHRGSGRGGRGGHNGRGRGGKGRGGTSGRGRGDSPEKPSKHILTADDKSDIARLKKRQAELRHFFQVVGTQQADILDIMAGRDLGVLMRKAKAHEKFAEYDEVLEDLAYHRDSKIAQVKAQYELAEKLALQELEDQKQLLEQQFRIRVENARLEHIKGAAGDLAIFKKAIAAGDDDAYTLAGSEADYFPRYHELPEADATVRGYNSSKIEDEKPFRRDLPSFDEVARRDVMEDEITRPVVEALHRKRAEEQAAIAREKQSRLDEEALEYSQTIDALADFANSERGKRDVADIDDYLNPRSMRAPQYGSFGLSALADAAEAFARPLPQKPQQGMLPLQAASAQYQPIYPNYEHQRGRSLHFPPPPPKLYIPQNPAPGYNTQQSPQRSAGPINTAVSGSGTMSSNKPYHTNSLPPTPLQIQPQSQPPTAGSTPTSSSARRSLRSIAPQPPPLIASNTSTQPNSQHQTYTFVPPQQPPQSTHFAPTIVPAKRNSPAILPTPASAIATPITQTPLGSGYPLSAGPGFRSMSQQPQNIAPAMYAPNMRSQPVPIAPERRASGPKQGQGKIAMQFFNSIVDGNGKRALLPKP